MNKLANTLYEFNELRQDNGVSNSMKRKIERITDLPPIPNIAQRIMELKNDRFADVKKLVRLIELDPYLAAQLLRWTSSPLYGSRKNISLLEAVQIVIGYEQVLNLAFGLCALSKLKVPVEGLFGTRFFWTSSLAGASLYYKLFRQMPNKPNINKLALSYLLHNAGYLLMAHLFKPEFEQLRTAAQNDTTSPIYRIERDLFGLDHGVLGAWLLHCWKLDNYLQIVTLNHHNPYYVGEEENLVWTICLTNSLLGMIEIGDARDFSAIQSPLCQNLHLEETAVMESLKEVLDTRQELTNSVNLLVTK